MKCTWTSVSGAECNSEALTGDPQGRCWFHSDTNQEERATARSRGGRASRATLGAVDLSIVLDSPEGVLSTLTATAEAIAAGRLDRSRANAIGYLAATAVQAQKLVSHERRIRKLEERLGLREPEEA